MVSLLIRMCKPIVGTGKDVILESGFCVVKSIIEIESKCMYEVSLIMKWYYLPNGVTRDPIFTYF